MSNQIGTAEHLAYNGCFFGLAQAAAAVAEYAGVEIFCPTTLEAVYIVGIFNHEATARTLHLDKAATTNMDGLSTALPPAQRVALGTLLGSTIVEGRTTNAMTNNPRIELAANGVWNPTMPILVAQSNYLSITNGTANESTNMTLVWYENTLQ